ncbi:SpvB/TcaC N-terminal domain-containing protein [Apibacter adventoris]|uniref:SpvB/TcaC N-terminal domain-containing protein n=1 Tax=Apibacter adventoris TaxID=1679466 RepID=UPI000CF71924|nr:SpvB/TcaC N-terminal domain-containing protein [Apibacter adventoris]PQL93520.1 type IV secretion protein Rhs [Apibacter adventoris]
MMKLSQKRAKGIAYFLLITMVFQSFAPYLSKARGVKRKTVRISVIQKGKKARSAEFSGQEAELKNIETSARQESAKKTLFNRKIQSPATLYYYKSGQDEGEIGKVAHKNFDNPEDNMFQVYLEKAPEKNQRVYLTYELYGVSDQSGVSRSINDLPSQGGYLVQSNARWTLQKEELRYDEIKKGENYILFTVPEKAEYGYKIKNLAIEIDPTPIASREVVAESYAYAGNDTYVKGFTTQKSLHQIEINGNQVYVNNGRFETILPGVVSEVEISTGQNKNKILTRIISGKPDYHHTLSAAPLETQKTFKKQNSQNHLSLSGAKIEVQGEKLLTDKNIIIRGLRSVDLPPLDMGLQNVTSGSEGYKFLPHGEHFKEGATVKIAYDRTKIPNGYTEKDIKTYYFDINSRHWVALERDSVDTQKQIIISHTTHFTDMINGVVQAPESPETQGFTPTTMSDIKVADPLAKVNVLSPPQSNNKGTAGLSYNFEMPPARNGMIPSLSIQYNSDASDGWLGEGWDLNIPGITLDTRWGVPRYDKTRETETYLLEGVQLLTRGADGKPLLAHRGEKEARVQDRLFYQRKEGSFSRIIRKGNTPGSYTWEVTDRKGTRYTYGGNNGVLKGNFTNANGEQQEVIAEWKLSRVEELHGDYIEYIYEQVDEPVRGGITSKALYLKEVHAGNRGESPHTVVKFDKTQQKQKQKSNARYGFLASQNQLLTRVEVNFEGKKLREYDLQYKSGAFYTDLLDQVTHKDDKGEEFTSNRFDYYDDVKSQEGYVPFKEEEESWASQGVRLNQSNTTSYGGSFYTGLGYFNGDTVFNSGTAGGSYSYSTSVTEGKSTFIDINGDGLPDKVYQEKGMLYYEPCLLPPFKGDNFGKPIAIKGVNQFSKTKSNTSNGGGSARAGFGIASATVGKSTGSTNTTTTVYFTDVNHDGLIDIVSHGKVYFNHITWDKEGNPVPSFTQQSSLTPSPIMGGGFVDSSDTQVDPKEQEDLIYNSPLYDIVKVWEAPFDGKIKIEGDVQLLSPQGDYDPEEYEKSDGVRVAIQFKGTERWNKSINKGDFSSYPTHVTLPETISQGDKIYFRVQSGNQEMSNGSFDQVNWDPVITYIESENIKTALDIENPDGQKVYIFPSKEANIASQSTVTRVPEFKKVIISGVLEKPITSDNVTVKVIQANDDRSQEVQVYEKTFAWNETYAGNLEIKVPEGSTFTNFYFSLTSPTNVNWKEVNWKPQIKVDEDDDFLPATVNYSIYRQIQQGSYYPVNFDQATDGEKPTKKFTITSHIIPENPSEVDEFSGDIHISVKKKTGLLGEYTITLYKGIITNSPAKEIEVTASLSATENIWVEGYTQDKGIIKNLKALQFTIQPEKGLPDQIRGNVFTPEQERGFGPMYRGWGQFIYNANAGRYAQPMKEKELVLPENENTQLDPRTMIFIPIGLDTETKSYWAGADRYVYNKGTIMSASRLGEKEVRLTNPLEGMSSKPSKEGGCLQGSTAVGVNLTSKSKNTTKQVGASVGVSLNYSDSEGSDETKISFSDMNGDGYPDIITPHKIQYTNTRGGFDGEIADAGKGYKGNHYSTSTSKAYAFGANPITAVSILTKKGDGEKKNSANAKASEVGISSVDLSFSAPKISEKVEHTLMDINGDGLPDKIYKNGKVRLNLGYGFTSEIDWDIDEIQKGKSEIISGGVELGLEAFRKAKSQDVASSSFSGGINVNTVTNTSKFSFIDVNNDGLVDKVRMSDGHAWVSLNKGASFAREIEWKQMSRISKSSSVSISTNVSYNINITIPLPFSIPLKLTLNPGVSSTTSTAVTSFEIKDVDADGYPDMVWTSNTGSIKVKRSAIGKTNKLKTVSNSLGGKFTLDYTHTAATYDHPGGKWVLSSVETEDGIKDDGSNTRVEYVYTQGKQDRHEREFLGFGKVEIHSIDTEKNNEIYRSTIQEYDVSDYYHAGNLLKSTLQDGSGNKYTETLHKYYEYEVKQKGVADYEITSTPLCSDNQSTYTPLKYTQNKVYEGGDRGMIINESFYEYGIKGLSSNLGEIIYYKYSDKGNLGENGTGPSNYQTRISYTANPAKHIYGLISKVVVTNNQGGTSRETDVSYDLNYANHITQITKYLEGGAPVTTKYTYDIYGNITQKTLPGNHKNEQMWYKYRYDSKYHMYVERIDDAYGYTSQLENYDYRYGIPLSSKDINGYFMETTLDNLGRILTVTGPNELELNVPYTIKNEYQPTAELDENGEIKRPAYAVTRHYDPQHPGDDIETVSFVDGFGAALQVKKEGIITETDAQGSHPKTQEVWIVSGRNKYDPFGRVIESYYPVTEDPSNKLIFNRTFDTVAPTRTRYDVLDRMLETTLPDETQSTAAYTLNPSDRTRVTTTTDALGGKQATYTNGSGLTVKTEQLSGPSGTITTRFTYDDIQQLTEVTDTEGQKTTSRYDMLGRRTQITHPSAGTVTLAYDDLGNVISRQTSNLAPTGKTINYEYEYTRLNKITYPEHPENNVTYYYGNKNAKENRVGRLMLQEDATGAQEFKYGTLGEVTEVRRTVIIPNQAIATYVTQMRYDSWNRIEQIIYPDEEKVSYSYNTAGLLTGVKGSKSYSYNYVNQIGYDKFEQRNYLKYCNGTETTYTYDPQRRRLTDLQVWTPTGNRTQIMDNRYTYDAVSNVLSVANQAPLPGNSSNNPGGQMKHEYTYDSLYRLSSAAGTYTGADGKTAGYQLTMEYDNLHNIVSKKQDLTQKNIMFDGGLSAGYELKYKYDSHKKNQITSLADQNYRNEEEKIQEKREQKQDWQYDPNGNLIYVNTSQKKKDGTITDKTGERKLLWDEENRLRALDDNGYVSNYWYDASGERVIKTSGESEQMYVNALFAGGNTQTGRFTAYINPYLVVSPNGKYTKHYYIGSQRIVSKLGDIESFGADPRRIEYAGDDLRGVKINWKEKYERSLQDIKDNYAYFEVPYHGKDHNDYVNGAGFCCEGKDKKLQTYGGGIGKGNEEYEKMQYYYHADHLGSSSYITNLDAQIVQHVEYVPFGEVFIEERNQSWNTPYLFNGKELDEETGLYYYGARYYNPRESIFLSVDPLFEKTMTPYQYTYQNPINYTDPDGKWPILINGRVSNDSERGSSTYWDKNVRETIKNKTGYYHSQFMYVDGDRGMLAAKRILNGRNQGIADAKAVYARMKETMKNGKITEQLQVISHSRGGAFANGYMKGLTAEIIKLAEKDKIGFSYGKDNIIEYSVNIAPHQSSSLYYPESGATNVNISHNGDILSGVGATGNVINVASNTDEIGFDQHGNATYNKELGFTLEVLENGKGNVKQQLQEKYKEWDKSRTPHSGVKSEVK